MNSPRRSELLTDATESPTTRTAGGCLVFFSLFVGVVDVVESGRGRHGGRLMLLLLLLSLSLSLSSRGEGAGEGKTAAAKSAARAASVRRFVLKFRGRNVSFIVL